MAETSLESFKNLIGDVSELPDALLEKILASASKKVKRDGVAVTHESFADLQEYFAASILETSGKIKGTLVSKSVADVSETYNIPANQKSFWDLYRSTLLNITGKRGFIV